MSFQELDFKSERLVSVRKESSVISATPRQLKKGIKLLLATSVVMLLGFSASNWQPSAKSVNSTLKLDRLHYSLAIPEPSNLLESVGPDAAPEIDENQWKTVTVKSGDTLASIFSKQGLSSITTHRVAGLNEQTKNLRYLQPGQTIELLIDEQQTLLKMNYIPDTNRTLTIQRDENQSLSSLLINHKLDAYPVFGEGVIKSSLFEAAANADIPEDVIMDLAAIFGWDIDFSLDIRVGDRFSIVYEELFKGDEKIRNGRILSAEFVNNGNTFRAVYYTDPSGNSDYYSPDGKSMRKAFLRSPVEFSRISSRFSKNRWHPVLSKWRSHKGVDYVASSGTPVRASGDGKISFAGNKGGYGRLVLIQHGGRYTTAYGHLSRFARGIRGGKKVKQGEVIGYVGRTGLATGPHLHYEFRVNGVHRNPLTVKLPEAKPVNSTYLTHFEQNTRAYLTMLRLMDRKLADNSQ